MKLNLECVRDLMLTVESLANGENDPFELCEDLPGQLQPYIFEEVEYHLHQCCDAGYIELGNQYIDGSCEIYGLTWRGHDALAAIMNPDAYHKAKSEWPTRVLDGLVSGSIEGFFSLAAEIAKSLIS